MPFYANDEVGLILDWSEGTVRYSINGEEKDIAFSGEALKSDELFPVACLSRAVVEVECGLEEEYEPTVVEEPPP